MFWSSSEPHHKQEFIFIISNSIYWICCKIPFQSFRMGPIRKFKRRKKAEKKVDQNVLAAAASASLQQPQLEPLDWWDDFSKRITVLQYVYASLLLLLGF
ncbi:hypothetical protein HS088_TW21G01741 [Tripterygium wilfordii]|uniref:Uncharacterized protein n=1 Tax=Tripterygium wilfordii TaxID=458696 RepID=A0A7J7C604_TRIWF|nr:hypothetical protein HS088_TW21G01741 [Tripterygium wilfordii]